MFLVYQSFHQPVYTTEALPEIDISPDPVQIANPDTLIPPIYLAGYKYTILPQAGYNMSAMVVSTRRYRRGYMSKLSPYDYATIWGKMPEYLPYIKFDQIVRFCLFNTKHAELVDIPYVLTHMTNNHLIPATPNLRSALSKARKKDLVIIDGYLVNVVALDKKNNISNWNSSLSRQDTGNGACEIIYVTRLRLNDRVYE
jgi:hypothetical protein